MDTCRPPDDENYSCQAPDGGELQLPGGVAEPRPLPDIASLCFSVPGGVLPSQPNLIIKGGGVAANRRAMLPDLANGNARGPYIRGAGPGCGPMTGGGGAISVSCAVAGSYCAAAAKTAAVAAVVAAAAAAAGAATEETEDGRFFERIACVQQKQL